MYPAYTQHCTYIQHTHSLIDSFTDRLNYCSIMSLPSWLVCCLWHHQPQHLDLTYCSHRGLVFMALLSAGLNPIYHHDPSTSSVTEVYLHYHPLPAVLPRVLFSVLNPLLHTSCPTHSVLSSPLFPSTTTFMQPTLNFHPPDFDLSTTTHLQNALQQISSGCTLQIFCT